MIEIDKEKYKKIEEYLSLVLEVNKNINLTRINNFNQAKTLHIDDSLTALQYFDDIDFNNSSKTILDLGSGCGFPGVALSIATDIPCTLVDSIAKKMNAVDDLVKECNLQDQIKTVSSRIEELDINNYLSDYVVSRAMASLPSVMELATPLIKQDGRLIVYKGDIDNIERTNGTEIQELLGLQLVEEKKIKLGENKANRTLFVFNKISEAKVKLPRRIGKAQKQPLKI